MDLFHYFIRTSSLWAALRICSVAAVSRMWTAFYRSVYSLNGVFTPALYRENKSVIIRQLWQQCYIRKLLLMLFSNVIVKSTPKVEPHFNVRLLIVKHILYFKFNNKLNVKKHIRSPYCLNVPPLPTLQGRDTSLER